MNKRLIRWLLGFAIIMLSVYIIFFEVQTYLGEQALEATGLDRVEFTRALELAKEKNKFILADMSAIWCPSCRKLDKQVFSNQSVKKLIEDNYIFTRLEYESKQGKAFMEKYDIKGFPTILILDGDGNKQFVLPPTYDADLFIDYLNDFLELQTAS